MPRLSPLLLVIGLAALATPAQAARTTFGSDLAAPASVSRSSSAGLALWPAATEVKEGGELLSAKVKGLALAGPSGPIRTTIHIAVLRAQGTSERLAAQSAAFHLPSEGDPQQVSTFSTKGLCVRRGDHVALTTDGGTFQILAASPGIFTSAFTAPGSLRTGSTLRGTPVGDTQLLLQTVIATGSDATATCREGPPLRLRDQTVGVNKRGRALVAVVCGQEACKGTATLSAGTRKLAGGPLSLAPNSTGFVRLVLSKAAIAQVRKGKGRQLRVRLRVVLAAGQAFTRQITLKV